MSLHSKLGFKGLVEINEANNIGIITSAGATQLRVNANGNISINGTVSAETITLLSKGNIAIANDVTAVGGISGGGILLVGAGNISTSALNVDITTGVAGGVGGNITMIAGADYVNSTPSFIQVTGASSTGGSIDFDTTDIASLSTSSAAAGSSGGC